MYVGPLPTASNRARYVVAFAVLDAETGDPVDLTDIDVILSIRDTKWPSDTPLLTATDGDGIDMGDAAAGIFELTFSATQMRTLCAKQYDVGCTITADDDAEEVDQFIIGTVSVLDGVVNP